MYKWVESVGRVEIVGREPSARVAARKNYPLITGHTETKQSREGELRINDLDYALLQPAMSFARDNYALNFSTSCSRVLKKGSAR